MRSLVLLFLTFYIAPTAMAASSADAVVAAAHERTKGDASAHSDAFIA